MVDSNTGFALREYWYGESVMTVYISEYRGNSKTTDYVLDGQIVDSIKTKDENFEIEIRKIKDKQDQKENYVAYWKTDTAFYQISGKMKEKEFVKLIQNIHF